MEAGQEWLAQEDGMAEFVTADRKTAYLLPPSMEDWLNEGHLTRFIVEVVDQLDLSNLTRQYAGRGSKAHHPATLLAILVYGYASGIFSSRKLEACHLRLGGVSLYCGWYPPRSRHACRLPAALHW